ncbi:hypothetical protein V2K55_13195 [Pseudomonas alliivorans]|nr:hypothetical protein [Pseudomonas alliivorans]MEE4778274.1 hypothetical protein [Pseudomonas alliivorans]
MSDDGSFRVILNFAQMAAILAHESLTPAEIMSNRIFGSLRLVGGIIELAGSGVLCALPEPTMISKLAVWQWECMHLTSFQPHQRRL